VIHGRHQKAQQRVRKGPAESPALRLVANVFDDVGTGIGVGHVQEITQGRNGRPDKRFPLRWRRVIGKRGATCRDKRRNDDEEPVETRHEADCNAASKWKAGGWAWRPTALESAGYLKELALVGRRVFYLKVVNYGAEAQSGAGRAHAGHLLL